MSLSKPMGEVTFRVGPLVNLPAIARSLGVDTDAIFDDLGIEPTEYNDPDARLPFSTAQYRTGQPATILVLFVRCQ